MHVDIMRKISHCHCAFSFLRLQLEELDAILLHFDFSKLCRIQKFWPNFNFQGLFKQRNGFANQTDLMSDLEDMNMMIGNFPENMHETNSEGREIDADLLFSEAYENRNLTTEELGSVLTSNSRGKNGGTDESARISNAELTSHMFGK